MWLPFTSYRDEVLYCVAVVQYVHYANAGTHLHRTKPLGISYEDGKIISAEETSAHGLQKLLYDPAPPDCRDVHNT